MNFFNQFWAPRNAYDPVGMFTRGHMFLLCISLILLIILLYNSRNLKRPTLEKITKFLAIIMVTLEGVKIYYSFSFGYTWLNEWFPIAYCSIFMYALLLSGYGNGKWKQMGQAFLAGGCVLGGTAFLLFPSTSLMMYPIWHFQCLYSMLFHTLMIYIGVMYLWKMNMELNKVTYKAYTKLYTLFALIAIIMNTTFNSNLMLLREPFKIPVLFVHQLVKDAPWLYTIFVFLVYLLGPFWITAYFINLIRRSKEKDTLKDLGEISV
ncbi:Integral membrane protein (intg_mem_TP0381) [Clostridium collagenovorans DSM 3089]|uniref:Integral membrane protein (Intg_mem_TP0381) n=1 Tax=Clostridium collagenovorans DSM 3089 TaxID=1121306 RepID=A0A1M5V0D9_9CLOT|nr:YwaF family protein [Clostridium collagenovorans]SHH68413.1 Integral membrane protein (intg_mem_TP0381) [Clostridium collagenovorans DSM 3089]